MDFSMEYIKDAFARTDLRQIRQFLLYGLDELDSESQSYNARLKNGCELIHNRLKSAYPEESEREQAVADLSKALTAYESVYMEIGMKIGARLIHQLLLTDDLPSSISSKD